MADALPPGRYYLCHACSYPIPVGEHPEHALECERCGHTNNRLKPKSAMLTMIFSLTALILYIPANFFPFMTIELYGNRNSSTIWSGVVHLFEDGAWGIAIVVLLASLIIPFLKLFVLLYLSMIAPRNRFPRFNTTLYRAVEAIGRWSMLDIFLLAVLVAIMKLGPWTTVEPEIGSVLFLFVVIFTMLASAQFDPHLLWENHNDKPAPTEN